MDRNLSLASTLLLLLLGSWTRQSRSQGVPGNALRVGMTLVKDAAATGAVCLDGSLPAYHLDRGFGSGARSWLLQFEGGGWCNDIVSCRDRASTRRGSTRLMNQFEVFSGILSNDPSRNPDFYNWNRVKIRYCDGASFGGDSEYLDGTTTLYFRGQRIWEAVVRHLLSMGLGIADNALLSGCSAGGLATFLHCDDFAKVLPRTATVKCLSDAGFFMDVADITGAETIGSYFAALVTLQGVQKSLNKACLGSVSYPYQCFFPQHSLPNIQTPYFVLNSAYDIYQFHHILVPQSSDAHGLWSRCRQNPTECNSFQISVLQGFRNQMLIALAPQEISRKGGLFINSCFAHCQSEAQDTWFASNSPMINGKTVAVVVGDWYFEIEKAKEIDCPYPCDRSCHNIIPANTTVL